MTIIIGLSLVLIVVGLIMCWLHTSVKYATLATIVLWVGIALVVIGLILLLSPVVLWVNHQLREMLGQ